MDKNHRWLIEHFIRCEPNDKYEIEKYYNDFGLKGYVDLYMRDEEEGKIDIYEFKSKIDDVGDILRQLNTPSRIYESHGKITKILVCFASKENLKVLEENKFIFKTSQIRIVFPFLHKDKVCFSFYDADIDFYKLVSGWQERGLKFLERSL